MFSYRAIPSTAPTQFVGTIKVSSPIRNLGVVTDVEGQQWHVEAIVTTGVYATPLQQLHPHYTDTSGAEYGLTVQHWYPYKVEVVK